MAPAAQMATQTPPTATTKMPWPRPGHYRRALNDFELERAYERMWATERASDDNRDMWRR